MNTKIKNKWVERTNKHINNLDQIINSYCSRVTPNVDKITFKEVLDVRILLNCLCAKELLKLSLTNKNVKNAMLLQNYMSTYTLRNFVECMKDYPELKDSYLLKELEIVCDEIDNWTLDNFLDGYHVKEETFKTAVTVTHNFINNTI